MESIKFFFVKRKKTITVLTIITLAVLIGAAFMHIRNLNTYKDDLEDNVALFSKFLSTNISFPLSFGPDYYPAIKTELGKVVTRPEVICAAVYDSKDLLVETFYRDLKTENIPEHPGNVPSKEYKGDFLYLFVPIELKSYERLVTDASGAQKLKRTEIPVQRVGTLYLKISTEKIKHMAQRSFVTVSIFFFSFIIFMLFLVSMWRRSMLTQEKQTLERTVEERTRELKMKNLQLEEQSLKLLDMDKMKSRFLANISHEFRTPLTLIMGPLEQMLSGSSDGEEKKKINLIIRNTHRLMGLINQLLELSKFDSRAAKLKALPWDIIPFLKGICASFEPVITQHELTLVFHSSEESIVINFDAEKLEKAVFNLLSNAVKFTPAGGKIIVEVKRNDTDKKDFPSGSLDISISDTGPGIPTDQLEQIFDRFFQSDNTYEHHHKGSGIGLTIAKEIVELHSGKIEVNSGKSGTEKGTEFIIRLPLDPVIMSANHGTPTIPRGINPVDMMMETNGTAEDEENGGEMDIDTLKPQQNIILIVEDSVEIRDYIRGIIEPQYSVVEAKDGLEGIQKAREIIPDLIISDIMMPRVNGYELCRELKSGIETCHIPIILLTAKASEESIIKGFETGADDYIVKPFSIRILSARVKNLIDLRSQLQQTEKREMALQPAKMSVSPMDKNFLKRIKEVIRTNLSDPDFSIELLCKEMEMSQPTLYRKVHALTGESPSEFIRSYRLKRAAQLLRDNFGSIIEVSVEVGFSSATYFTKCFKKKFHQLPSAYLEIGQRNPLP